MYLMVLYDISSDRLRAKIADACLDYGLERVQFSAFAGELSRVHQRELELRIRDLVGRQAAKVRFIPLDTPTWRRQHVIHHVSEPVIEPVIEPVNVPMNVPVIERERDEAIAEERADGTSAD